MKVIEHPFFETLYIDPDEGLYWQQELDIAGKKTHVAFYIEEAALVTDECITFAEAVISDRESLAQRAREALQNNLGDQPQGVCARYIHNHLPDIGPKETATLDLPQGITLSLHNFINYMCIDLFAVYPTEELTPLIIDFTIGEDISDAVLSVSLTRDLEVAVIDYEE